MGSDSREIDPTPPATTCSQRGESGWRTVGLCDGRPGPTCRRYARPPPLSVPSASWATIPGWHLTSTTASTRLRRRSCQAAHRDGRSHPRSDKLPRRGRPGFRELVAAIGGVPTYFDTAWCDGQLGPPDIKGEGCVTSARPGARLRPGRHPVLDPESGDWESRPHWRSQALLNRQQLLGGSAVDEGVPSRSSQPTRHLNRLIQRGRGQTSASHLGFTFDDMVSLAAAFSDTNSDGHSPAKPSRSRIPHAWRCRRPHPRRGRLPAGCSTSSRHSTRRRDRGHGHVVDVANGSGVDGQAQAVSDAPWLAGSRGRHHPDTAGRPLAVTPEVLRAGLGRRPTWWRAPHRRRHPGPRRVAGPEPGASRDGYADFTTVQPGRPPAGPHRRQRRRPATARPSSTPPPRRPLIGHSAGDPAPTRIDCE